MISLRNYQEEAADFLYEHDRAMVLAPVGAGKTAITLTAMRDAILDDVVGRFLVLAPKRVAEHVWPVEAAKWASSLSLAVAVGTPRERLAALNSDADVVVTNYENLQWLAEQTLDFDGVVFDELTRLKNPSGKRFKALSKVVDAMQIRWGLTGSFTSNGLEDVFGQCKIIDQKLLGRAKGAFLQQYFYCLNREYNDWQPRPGALEAVMERIRPATYLLEPGEYRDALPPLHVVPVRCQLDDRAPYEKMKKDFVVDFPDAQAIAANAAAVTMKLQQMACLAHDTPVLTDAGWLPIQNVTTQRVWDGVEWVAHDGCIFKGVKEVVDCFSVQMTYNHLVLTVEGWKTAKDVIDGNAGKKFTRHDVRLPDSYCSERIFKTENSAMAVPLCLRKASNANESILTRLKTATTKLWMQAQQHCSRNDRPKAPPYLGAYVAAMFVRQRQRLQGLRRSWHYRGLKLAKVIYVVLGRYARYLRRRFDFGSNQQRRPVLQRKLSLGYVGPASGQPAREYIFGYSRRPYDYFASRALTGYANANSLRKAAPIQMAARKSTKYARTYDIVNCGPRNRFVVRGADGKLLIVHNCGFVYNSTRTLAETPGAFHVEHYAMWFSRHKMQALADLLDENQRANTIIAYNFIEELAELRRWFPHAQTLDDDRAIERWNAGEIELLLIHPKSAGHGLNLQSGGHHLVFTSLPWSLELYEQTIGRLHRSGQRHDVWVYVLITDDTIDERILGALHDKRSLSDLAMEALK